MWNLKGKVYYKCPHRKELCGLVKANYQDEVADHEREMRSKIGYEEGFKKQYSKAISELRIKGRLTKEEERDWLRDQDSNLEPNG